MPYDVGSGRGDGDTTAIDECHQASRLDDGGPEVVAVTFDCLPRVEAHANAEAQRLRPLLGLQRDLSGEGRRCGLLRRVKRSCDAIAASGEHPAIEGTDGVPQDLVVPDQRACHGVVVSVPGRG